MKAKELRQKTEKELDDDEGLHPMIYENENYGT